MYNSRSSNAITPVMQKFHSRPKARVFEEKKVLVDAYEMLKDSPQPHCSAEDDVSNLARTNRFVYQLTDVWVLEDEALVELVLQPVHL
jgi:hypothetical protein